MQVELTAYAFDPNTWGSVAAWIGAIGTGGGFFIASLVYRSSAKRDKWAQARQVRVAVASQSHLGIGSLNPQPYKLVVHNFSDRHIFQLTAGMARRSLIQVVLPGGWIDLDNPRSTEDLENIKKERMEAIVDGFPDTPSTFKLSPNQSHEFAFLHPMTPYLQGWVMFTDANGEMWRYTIGEALVDEDRLEHIRGDGWTRLMKWVNRSERIFNPRQGRRRRQERKRLRGWAYENKEPYE